jgi:hypothetical protein
VSEREVRLAKTQATASLAPPIDPGGVAGFIARLCARPGVRLGSDTLWVTFAAAFPRRPGGAAERQWFLAALEAAEAEGVVRLPARAGRLWDRTAWPSVPTSVDRVREAPAPKDDAWRRLPWHPALQWVPDLARANESDVAFLRRVHEGLVRGTFDEPAPFKYRSLELTGDEKRLGELTRGALFATGRLTLELLGCSLDTLPLAWEDVGSSPAVLAVENHATFGLALKTLRELAATSNRASPYGVVAYGSGKCFPQSVAWLAKIRRPIEQIHYVGDLDWPGLEIATAASAAAVVAGLPPVEAAPGVHAAMLMAAERFGAADGWPYDKAAPPSGADALLAWLPPDVRDGARRVLRAGRRVPEEALGPAMLRALWRGDTQG